MVKIRYHLAGRSGQRIFWIVVIDSRKKRSSKDFLDKVGVYNPKTKDILGLNKEKINKWIQNGAQPTKSVKELFHRTKTI